MDIHTKYKIDQDVFYLKREKIIEICSTCNGEKKINVTNGVHNWNIKCPDCHGKGKASSVIRYGVSSETIKEVIARRGEQKKAYTKYLLYNGMEKNEVALFTDVEEAENKCSCLNDQIDRNKKKIQ